jgi:hypothetical protein
MYSYFYCFAAGMFLYAKLVLKGIEYMRIDQIRVELKTLPVDLDAA